MSTNKVFTSYIVNIKVEEIDKWDFTLRERSQAV